MFGNSLATLPDGLFDDLHLLRVLRLNDNRLTALPVDIFDQLFLLEELTLTGNRLTALPDGMFDDLSRFKGVLTGDDVGGLARLRQFLADHEPETPGEFISALPDLHKQHFTFAYHSQGLGAEFVSSTHPRAITWGADGEFVFAWQTNPNASEMFRDSIEFLVPGDSSWIAGIVDFSGDEAAIVQPASCQTCHGSLNKPLWGSYFWVGAENRPERRFNSIAWSQAMEALVGSTSDRVAPLDFSNSVFAGGDNSQYFSRYLKPSSNRPPYMLPEEAFSVALTMRHAEVLFSRLKAREDYAEHAQKSFCASNPATFSLRPLSGKKNWHIGLTANTIERVGGPTAALPTSADYEHRHGTLGDALVFLMLHDFWQSRAAVRQLYRNTPNGDVPRPGGDHRATKDDFLLYGAGTATAEDELIQLYRLLFGFGNSKSIAALNAEHANNYDTGSFTADLGYGHTFTMAPKVCTLLGLDENRAHGLTAARGLGQVRLTWTAPTNLTGITGYRIMRGAAENSMTALVADTGSTATAYTDTTVNAGTSYVYSVIVLKGSETGNESVRVTVDPSSPRVAGPTAFTVTEGDTAVATLTATDEDTTAANLTWSTYGGADSGSFTLSSAGVESPDDARLLNGQGLREPGRRQRQRRLRGHGAGQRRWQDCFRRPHRDALEPQRGADGGCGG